MIYSFKFCHILFSFHVGKKNKVEGGENLETKKLSSRDVN